VATSSKSFLLGLEVFGKDGRFDPRTDPIVRVQARRLRVRLARYYSEEGREDDVLIDLPKGGYAPVIKRHKPQPKRLITAALFSRNTVAVIPFTDYSPQGDREFFCQDVGEQIIQTLPSVGCWRSSSRFRQLCGANREKCFVCSTSAASTGRGSR
jgi:hypothetical protein